MKSPFHSLALIAVAALCFGAASSLRAGVINGGFEDPDVGTNVPPYGIIAGGGSFTGWNVGGSDVLLIDSLYSEAGPGVTFNSHGGQQALDITGAGNTSPLNSITQSLATIAGASYTLSFWLGNATGNPNDTLYDNPSSVSLLLDNSFADLFTNANTTVGGVNWALQSYTFTALNSSTDITFLNSTPVGDNYAGLDDISIQQVPEPTSMVLFATAGLASLLLRRRRR